MDYFQGAFAGIFSFFFFLWLKYLQLHGNKIRKQSVVVQRSQIVCGTLSDMIFIDCLLTFDEKTNVMSAVNTFHHIGKS